MTKTQIYSAEAKDQGRVLTHLHQRALWGETHQWVVVWELIWVCSACLFACTLAYVLGVHVCACMVPSVRSFLLSVHPPFSWFRDNLPGCLFYIKQCFEDNWAETQADQGSLIPPSTSIIKACVPLPSLYTMYYYYYFENAARRAGERWGPP